MAQLWVDPLPCPYSFVLLPFLVSKPKSTARDLWLQREAALPLLEAHTRFALATSSVIPAASFSQSSAPVGTRTLLPGLRDLCFAIKASSANAGGRIRTRVNLFRREAPRSTRPRQHSNISGIDEIRTRVIQIDNLVPEPLGHDPNGGDGETRTRYD